MARSKEFEESVVLDKAMRLFWEQGYEKTSIRIWSIIWESIAEACMTHLAINTRCF